MVYFFCSYKNELFFLIGKNYCKMQKTDMMVVVKKKLLNIILKKKKEVLKENTKNKYRNLSEEEKRSKKTSQKSIKGTIKQKKMKYIFFVS